MTPAAKDQALSRLQTATNVIFVGPPGVGKTHLALALAHLALQTGYSARFTTLRELAEELDTVTWRQQRRRYLTPRLLLIDEVGYLRLTPSQAHALFDLVTARYEQGAILLTSNRSFTDWGRDVGLGDCGASDTARTTLPFSDEVWLTS